MRVYRGMKEILYIKETVLPDFDYKFFSSSNSFFLISHMEIFKFELFE